MECINNVVDYVGWLRLRMFLNVKMEWMMECIHNVVDCSRRSWVVTSSDVFECKKSENILGVEGPTFIHVPKATKIFLGCVKTWFSDV